MVSIIDLGIFGRWASTHPTRSSSGQLGIQIHVDFKCFFLGKIGIPLNKRIQMGAINPSKLGTFDTNYFIKFFKRLKFSKIIIPLQITIFCEGKICHFEKIPFFEKKIQKN
jgi:hypothetical protein